MLHISSFRNFTAFVPHRKLSFASAAYFVYFVHSVGLVFHNAEDFILSCSSSEHSVSSHFAVVSHPHSVLRALTRLLALLTTEVLLSTLLSNILKLSNHVTLLAFSSFRAALLKSSNLSVNLKFSSNARILASSHQLRNATRRFARSLRCTPFTFKNSSLASHTAFPQRHRCWRNSPVLG